MPNSFFDRPMNWRPPESKVNVVKRYLMSNSPGGDIVNGADFDTMSEFFGPGRYSPPRVPEVVSRVINGKPRSPGRLHKLRGAPELDDPHAGAPVHEAHECF